MADKRGFIRSNKKDMYDITGNSELKDDIQWLERIMIGEEHFKEHDQWQEHFDTDSWKFKMMESAKRLAHRAMTFAFKKYGEMSAVKSVRIKLMSLIIETISRAIHHAEQASAQAHRSNIYGIINSLHAILLSYRFQDTLDAFNVEYTESKTTKKMHCVRRIATLILLKNLVQEQQDFEELYGFSPNIKFMEFVSSDISEFLQNAFQKQKPDIIDFIKNHDVFLLLHPLHIDKDENKHISSTEMIARYAATQLLQMFLDFFMKEIDKFFKHVEYLLLTSFKSLEHIQDMPQDLSLKELIRISEEPSEAEVKYFRCANEFLDEIDTRYADFKFLVRSYVLEFIKVVDPLLFHEDESNKLQKKNAMKG